MGKHIRKLIGINIAKNTDLYSPTLVKVVEGTTSRLLTKKIGPTNTELVIIGDTLATLEIVKKVTEALYDSAKFNDAVFV